jgi:hypothetical protein
MGLEVIEGHYGPTDLSGAHLVLAAKWPKAIHEGNGTCVLFISDEATPRQVEGLGMIFSGQAGGMPWEAIAGTMVSVTGPIVTKIDMKVDGNQSSFSVPGFVDMRLTQLSDVMSGEPKDVHIVYPQGGFLWDDGRIGTTETMRVRHEAVSFEHPGRFAAYATPVWTNQS